MAAGIDIDSSQVQGVASRKADSFGTVWSRWGIDIGTNQVAVRIGIAGSARSLLGNVGSRLIAENQGSGRDCLDSSAYIPPRCCRCMIPPGEY